MDKIESTIEKLKTNKEKFSLYSLIGQYKLTKEEAVKLCSIAVKDSDCFVFYLLICDKCKEPIEIEYLKDLSLIGNKKKCYKCGKSFTIDKASLEYIYEYKNIEKIGN